MGIDYLDGRIIDHTTEDYIMSEKTKYSEITEVFTDLLERGLHPRPGFKYGTKWRCYDKKIGLDHAPWLIVEPSKIKLGKRLFWRLRLASGVNKIWLQPLKINDDWKYLELLDLLQIQDGRTLIKNNVIILTRQKYFFSQKNLRKLLK